jgi:hypothetical protein
MVRTPFTAATGGLRSEKERDTPEKNKLLISIQQRKVTPRLRKG